MIKIGIDLSTTKTGVVGIAEWKYGKVNKIVIDNTNMKDISLVYANFKIALSEFVKSLSKWINNDFMVGIEISNYKNAKLTQKFSMYAGLIIAILNELGIKNIKWFNSNQWQSLIGCKPSDERNVRKEKAREFVEKYHNCDKWEQDEIDAYCIAYHLEHLVSTIESAENVKQNKKNKQREMSNKIKVQNMVNTRIMKINKLDKVKNAKRIETLKKEIEELGFDMEKRVWK